MTDPFSRFSLIFASDFSSVMTAAGRIIVRAGVSDCKVVRWNTTFEDDKAASYPAADSRSGQSASGSTRRQDERLGGVSVKRPPRSAAMATPAAEAPAARPRNPRLEIGILDPV